MAGEPGRGRSDAKMNSRTHCADYARGRQLFFSRLPHANGRCGRLMKCRPSIRFPKRTIKEIPILLGNRRSEPAVVKNFAMNALVVRFVRTVDALAGLRDAASEGQKQDADSQFHVRAFGLGCGRKMADSSTARKWRHRSPWPVYSLPFIGNQSCRVCTG